MTIDKIAENGMKKGLFYGQTTVVVIWAHIQQNVISKLLLKMVKRINRNSENSYRCYRKNNDKNDVKRE